MRIGVTVPNIHETLAERTTIESVGRSGGLRLLLFFGDELQIPTTGVAVDPGVLALDDPR